MTEVCDFQGKRRWPTSAAQHADGGRYYTFQEWIEHCNGDEEFAADLWLRAWTEDMDRAYWLEKNKELEGDVDALDPVLFEQLSGVCKGKVVLQYCCSGNSLRAGDNGDVELGGSGPRAQLNLEVLHVSQAHAIMECEISLRCESCPCDGKHLREHAGKFDFLGTPESSGAIFKMLFGRVSESQAMLISLVSMSGQYLGTFALKWAWDPAWARSQWVKELLVEASILADKDPAYGGKRYHRLDVSKSCFTFQEWTQFIAENGWGGPFSSGAQVLARHAWLNECVTEPDDATSPEGAWTMINRTDCMDLD
jgi:hypothetical protein